MIFLFFDIKNLGKYFAQICQTCQTNIYLDITRVRLNYRTAFTRSTSQTVDDLPQLRKPRTRTVSIGLISASSSFTRTRGIALTRWTEMQFTQKWGDGGGKWRAARIILRKKCSYIALCMRQIEARSDVCYKSFRFTCHARWRTRSAFSMEFSLVLTALFHPISATSPPFGKSSFCSHSECARDDKRLILPSRSRMV